MTYSLLLILFLVVLRTVKVLYAAVDNVATVFIRMCTRTMLTLFTVLKMLLN